MILGVVCYTLMYKLLLPKIKIKYWNDQLFNLSFTCYSRSMRNEQWSINDSEYFTKIIAVKVKVMYFIFEKKGLTKCNMFILSTRPLLEGNESCRYKTIKKWSGWKLWIYYINELYL